MPRSITGTSLGRSPARRSPVRRVVLLAAAAAVTAGLTAGCSSGQITQTDRKVPAVLGINVDSPDRRISLRDAMVVYHQGGYHAGSPAPLSLRIFNNDGIKPVKLTKVTSKRGTVLLVGGVTPSAEPSAEPSAAPSSTASGTRATASPSVSGSARGTAGPSASTGTEPSAAAPAPAPAGSTNGVATFTVGIEPRGITVLEPDAGTYLAILLDSPLAPGESVPVEFQFDDATIISINVPVGVPSAAPARSPIQFDGGNGSDGNAGH